MKKATTTIFICLLTLSLVFISGCTDNQDNLAKGKNSGNITNETPNKNVSDKEYASNISSLKLERQNAFSKYYNKENLQFEGNVPSYSLPLEASDISNYDNFTQKISLTNESKNLLFKNGFVVIENGNTENLLTAG